jgi:hypothetical protein
MGPLYQRIIIVYWVVHSSNSNESGLYCLSFCYHVFLYTLIPLVEIVEPIAKVTDLL